MFGWFKKKKPERKVKVVHNQYADQRGARAKGDIVGGNKSTWSPTPTYDPLLDPLNPISPLSTLNPINSYYDEPKSSSHDSGSSWSSSDSSSSYSSSDSGSSYSDSGSSY